MSTLLKTAATAAFANFASLALAAWILDDVRITLGWYLVAALLVTALSVTLREIVVNTVNRFVRGYTIAGGLVLTAVVLLLVELLVPRDGFSIDGAFAWVATILIVWAANVAYGEVDKQAPVAR